MPSCLERASCAGLLPRLEEPVCLCADALKLWASWSGAPDTFAFVATPETFAASCHGAHSREMLQETVASGC